MRNHLIILLLFVFSFGFSQTKDSLSLKEQQRRKENIQAGNPFKKFGYKPKIHTLSKGKYLEFHDLDSIVKIGSFSFHVKNKTITGYLQEETNISEATLKPEIVSRWFSPDPLSDEFPSWSPYNFVLNDPIRFVDPDGMAPDDITLRGKNNSSLTIKTDIVDVSLNVSSLGIDFGGKQTLAGNDILEAALDIGGLVDQTGIIDGAAAIYHGNNGDWGNAIISGISLAPGGDLLKLGKVPKHVKTIENAIDSVKKIGPAGDAGANVTKQIPADWTMKSSKKGNGTKFSDPKNPSGNNVRVQGGNSKSSNPAQQNPYVKQTKSGKTVDVNGNKVNPKSAEAHIPKNDFKYKK